MKLISTETSYLLNQSMGLIDTLELPYGLEVEVSEEDAAILLTLPGVVKAKSELLNVEIETQETKTSKAKLTSIKEI